MTDLARYGWTKGLARRFKVHASEGLLPGRVVSEHRGAWRVHTGETELECKVPGKWYRGPRIDLPAVGDWVGVRKGRGRPLIHAVLERKSVFVRKVAGTEDREQVIASNIDNVFVMMGLGDDFNIRRLERYLAATLDSGARPIVVLNKLDLNPDSEAREVEARVAAVDCPVMRLCAKDADSIELLAPYTKPGTTICLVGSSGVGKSTLTNLLMRADVQETAAVRERDAKGRHTTTHRELFVMPGGALLIDTPGMREMSLWAAEGGLDEAFSDVVDFGHGCKFRDCKHGDDESGCEVWAAVGRGDLREDRARAYVKLRLELAEQATRRELAARKVGRGRKR
ncbi:MAG: ribosome small subunit-dependent GTPase A [Proteobacteria bacterium]|nr:ribosome small subunit-dependent GTPase A [Pseudomonadota bacterium]MCP4921454.1 ribosome small subunit-dependent GTPase A [Pseudomonadota bacterium]